jgi:hypothetical protein
VQLERRIQPIALVGYLITALATASIGLATTAGHVLMARAAAWLDRGIRTPVRKALMTHVPMVHLHVVIHWFGLGNFA